MGALQLPLEEVWRRLEPELVQSSGFKNSSLGQGTVSHWSACKDGWGRGPESIITLAGLRFPPTFQDLARKDPVKLVDRYPPNGQFLQS